MKKVVKKKKIKIKSMHVCIIFSYDSLIS
jgi:hypothetical protein